MRRPQHPVVALFRSPKRLPHILCLACAGPLLAGCTLQDQLAAARGALDAVRGEQAAEAARDPVRAYFEDRNMSEAMADLDEIEDWCEEVRDRWGDDARDDSPTYDQVCERLVELLAEPECPACPRPIRPESLPSASMAPPPAASALPAAVRDAEGLHDPPSPDANGFLHIGHGVNLSALAAAESAKLWREATDWADRWTDVPACRDALAEIHYALGAPSLRGFKRMLGEIESRDWTEAAYELRQSDWARTVGARAERIASTLAEDCP